MSSEDSDAERLASHTWSGDSTLVDDSIDDGFEPPEGTSVGRYVVLSTLGRGATGVVVSAFDAQLDRKVALKFLHRAIAGDEHHGQLRREAQALARLTHPNVIRVHDVGTFDGRVFMATELVVGSDLATWREQHAPSWRDVVRAMLAAGAGLAAAHGAGLVHRDFKPRNVLMGEDGRPRVTDFGQARGVDEAVSLRNRPDARSRPDDDDDDPLDERPLDGSATRTGFAGLAGTPAYMAPEQLDGASPDPLADQWSFCVTLYEMLWGRRPFTGKSLSALARSIRRGTVPAPPARSKVPRGLRRVLRKGLSNDPQQRYGSMDALLLAIRRAVYWPRRVAWVVLPTTAISAVAVAAWPATPEAVDYCAEHDRRIDALWDDDRQDTIEQAFEASGLAYAPTTFVRVHERVDAFAGQLREDQRTACEAQANGEPVDAQMLCLHRQLEELRSLVELFEGADADVVEHAVEATRALDELSRCEDTDGPAAPTDPQMRHEIEQIDAQLARAHVAAQAGQRAQARALATTAAEKAEALGLRWQHAEAQLALAVVADDDGDAAPAQAAFGAAFSAGLAAGHDAVVARAAMGVAGLHGREGSFEEADRWMGLAEAATQRRAERSDDPHILARLENNRGRIDFHRGKFEPALDHFNKSLNLDEQAGRHDSQEGATRLNVGLALSSLGRYDEALESLEDALSLERYHFGEEHPRAVRVLNSLCHVRSYAGQLEAALEACDEGIAITRGNGGDDNPKLVHLYTNLGSVLFRAGRYPETQAAYRQALDRAIAIYGDGDPMVGNLYNNLGVLYVETGELAKAQDYYGRALTLFDSVYGTQHPTTGILRTNLAMAFSNDGKLDRAEPLLQESISVLESTLGADHVDLALSLAELGRLRARRQEHAAAISLLTRAMTLREGAGGEPIELADTKYSLGLSLWEMGERAEARARLGEARELYAQVGGERVVRIEEIDAWLSAHPLRGAGRGKARVRP